MQGKDKSRSPQQQALGIAARRVRGWKRLSQEEVGFRARLHRNYVGAIERGEINPSFRTLVRLTAGLRIKLSDLIVIYDRQLADAGR